MNRKLHSNESDPENIMAMKDLKRIESYYLYQKNAPLTKS